LLSRASIVSLTAPEETEIKYEINRRTQFKLDPKVVDIICDSAYGNMRTAILYALGNQHVDALPSRDATYELLRTRPVGTDCGQWLTWAIETEVKCRDAGLDLRDVLRLGWPNHPLVNATCATWPRLGGTSPRTLFFDCVGTLSGAVDPPNRLPAIV
jgi:hypothetical protein